MDPLVTLSPGDGRLNALRGAAQHDCRLYKSLRSCSTLARGGWQDLRALDVIAPRVDQGVERYLIDADGQTVFG